MIINNNQLIISENDNQWYCTKLVGEIFFIQLSLLRQWYLTKSIGEVFCGTSDKSDTNDKSDTSNTGNSSDASKTSASETRLSSYYF